MRKSTTGSNSIEFRYYIYNLLMLFNINPHTPIAQRVADEVVFRRFQGKELEFF